MSEFRKEDDTILGIAKKAYARLVENRPERGLSMSIHILFEPHDLWIGVYWRTFMEGGDKMLQLYVCILPTLPIQITFPIRKWAGWDAYDKGS